MSIFPISFLWWYSRVVSSVTIISPEVLFARMGLIVFPLGKSKPSWNRVKTVVLDFFSPQHFITGMKKFLSPWLLVIFYSGILDLPLSELTLKYRRLFIEPFFFNYATHLRVIYQFFRFFLSPLIVGNSVLPWGTNTTFLSPYSVGCSFVH